MKGNITGNYQLIKEAMNSNIATIRLLVEQADSLNKIVKNLNGDTGDTKKEIEEQIEAINNTIGELIDKTSTLFDLYRNELENL